MHHQVDPAPVVHSYSMTPDLLVAASGFGLSAAPGGWTIAAAQGFSVEISDQHPSTMGDSYGNY